MKNLDLDLVESFFIENKNNSINLYKIMFFLKSELIFNIMIISTEYIYQENSIIFS